MLDKFRDECGVFGIFGHPEAANLTYLGLYALQHRGQESAGIVASDGTQLRQRKAMGYVHEAFDAESLAKLPGTLAIGHVRYSTAGESKLANAQPIVIDSVHGQFAIGHNGNLVNAGEIRQELEALGHRRTSGLPCVEQAVAIGRSAKRWILGVEGAMRLLTHTLWLHPGHHAARADLGYEPSVAFEDGLRAVCQAVTPAPGA